MTRQMYRNFCECVTWFRFYKGFVLFLSVFTLTWPELSVIQDN